MARPLWNCRNWSIPFFMEDDAARMTGVPSHSFAFTMIGW